MKVQRKIRRYVGLAVLGLAALWRAEAHASQSVSVAWNPSTDTNTVGYVVSYGASAAANEAQVDVGTNTSATISGLREGETFYFVVTSYNAQRLQSDPSNEIQYLVPGTLSLTPPGKGNPSPTLKFPVANSHWYEVQATRDFSTWTTIWQTSVSTSNAWTQFTDSSATNYPSRFYRLVMH